jgi:hypothetical protein
MVVGQSHAMVVVGAEPPAGLKILNFGEAAAAAAAILSRRTQQ